MRYKAVLFDLDGTLLDTLSDLAAALNAARQMNGLPAQDTEQIKSFIGNGRRKLIERSLGADPAGYDIVFSGTVSCNLWSYRKAAVLDTETLISGIRLSVTLDPSRRAGLRCPDSII